MIHDGPVLRPLGEPLGALPRYGLIGGSGVQVGFFSLPPAFVWNEKERMVGYIKCLIFIYIYGYIYIYIWVYNVNNTWVYIWVYNV